MSQADDIIPKPGPLIGILVGCVTALTLIG